MKVRIALVVGFLLQPPLVFAQQSPEDVLRAFFKAEDDGRWLDAARMLNLNTFERVRQHLVEGARHRGDFQGPTVESMLRMDPDMPRAVAEYQVRETQRHMRDYDYIAQEFARVSSVDSLAALPVDEAAARWLEAKGPEWRTELQWRDLRSRPRNECSGLSDSAVKATQVAEARRLRAVIRGSTPDTGLVSYVVVDVVFPGAPSADSLGPAGPLPRAVKLRKLSAGWKIDPAPDLPNANGMAGMYTFAVACGTGSLIEKPLKK